jgi:predicted nuclease of predicted toxin-antitoxin system
MFLFDQKLSPLLVNVLADVFPESLHVECLGLSTADDEAIWQAAVEKGLAILSKDEDFRHRSALRGPPSKVVWLRLGNCTTKRVEETLRMSASIIRAFLDEEESALLVLGHAAKP